MTTTTAEPVALVLHACWRGSAMLLQRNLAAITEADAARPVGEGINTVVWVVGHAAYWRHFLANQAELADVVELEPMGVFMGQRRGPPPDTSPWSLTDVVELYQAAGRRLDEAFANAITTGGPPGFLSLAGKLLAHDAYHAGQVAILRRMAGYPGVL